MNGNGNGNEKSYDVMIGFVALIVAIIVLNICILFCCCHTAPNYNAQQRRIEINDLHYLGQVTRSDLEEIEPFSAKEIEPKQEHISNGEIVVEEVNQSLIL